MRYLIRILRIAFANVFSRQPPARGRPVSVPIRKTDTKKTALSGAAVLAAVESLPEADVKWVYDGDTVLVAKGWTKIVVRLDSIDCPEDGQEWGDIARFGLIKLIGGRKIYLEEHGFDDYGRTLASIFVRNPGRDEWTNVNERMVTLGHAWVMRKYYDHLPRDRQEKLDRLESWARSKQIGLWSNDNPTPPWRWRKRCATEL